MQTNYSLVQQEITTSLERSRIAGLINPGKRKVHRQALLEFIEYGIHVVFPVIPGGITNGIYTSHSHPFIKEHIISHEPYVWPYIEGSGRGQSITPLYPNAVKAALLDESLYKILALVDVIRVGRVREMKVALEEIKRLVHHASD